MHFRDKMALLLLLSLLITPGKSLLFPLLFPLSIKITIHSKPAPPPDTSYHFEAVPAYQGISVKGHAHISSVPKYSYGDGTKYGTSYGNGHVKVYTEEPHTKAYKYVRGYGSGGSSIDGQITISSNPAPPTVHFKGTTYVKADSHFKGAVSFPQTQYTGGSNGCTQCTAYDNVPQTHYKGTEYYDVPQTHYKGTSEEPHYKGTTYDGVPQTHYQGTVYEDAPNHYSGSSGSSKPKHIYKHHNYIKPVGGYKLTDYISDDKSTKYPDDTEYVAVPPGKTFAEIEAAHKAAHRPKAYSAEEYADLGSRKYNKKEYEHEPSYLDDSLPVYKENVPRPQYRTSIRRRLRYKGPHQESSSRYDRLLPDASETKVYAGFGTSVYGDSYAKIVYVPKNLKISITAYSTK